MHECVSLETLVIGPSGFHTSDVTTLSYRTVAVTPVWPPEGDDKVLV